MRPANWHSKIVKKGWVTRKRNQRLSHATAKSHAKLSTSSISHSERMKKAWVTRKKNQAKKRAEAEREAQLSTPANKDEEDETSSDSSDSSDSPDTSIADDSSGQFNLH